MSRFTYNSITLAAAALFVLALALLAFLGGSLVAAAIIVPLSAVFPHFASLPDAAITNTGLNLAGFVGSLAAWKIFKDWPGFCYAVHGRKPSATVRFYFT